MKKKIKATKLGFTLAEVLVAMFVIVVGIAGVTASIWWATKHKDTGREITEATNYCRMLTEAIMSRSGGFDWASYAPWPSNTSGVNDAASDRRPIFSTPFANLGQEVTGQRVVTTAMSNVVGSSNMLSNDASRFTRNIQLTRLGTTGKYDNKLARVLVTVYWQHKEIEKRVVMETITKHTL